MAYSTRPNFQYSLLATALLAVWSGNVFSASLTLSPLPLFVTTTAKANVLLMFSNANNMDEDPTGLAVGSGPSGVYNPAYMNSKSDIARTAARSLVANYTGKINMGLMAYQQSSVAAQWLNQSPYDASYNPANYNASFTGSRASTTKKFKAPNPTSSNATGACTTSSGAAAFFNCSDIFLSITKKRQHQTNKYSSWQWK